LHCFLCFISVISQGSHEKFLVNINITGRGALLITGRHNSLSAVAALLTVALFAVGTAVN